MFAQGKNRGIKDLPMVYMNIEFIYTLLTALKVYFNWQQHHYKIITVARIVHHKRLQETVTLWSFSVSKSLVLQKAQ